MILRPLQSSRVPLFAALLLCSAAAITAIIVAFDYSAEQRAYVRLERDVRSAIACVRSGASERFVEAPRSPDAAHPCVMHAMSLEDTVRDEAIRHERERALQLTSRVRAALDAAAPNNARALDALFELERRSAQRTARRALR